MTLGNMRANGVRSLAVSCHLCHHQSPDSWPDDVPVPSFGPRMLCTRCGIIGADARPSAVKVPRSGTAQRARRVRNRSIIHLAARTEKKKITPPNSQSRKTK
jgi:hypothetical protein